MASSVTPSEYHTCHVRGSNINQIDTGGVNLGLNLSNSMCIYRAITFFVNFIVI